MDNNNTPIDQKPLSALLEAYLFAKGNPATLKELADVFGEDPEAIQKALSLLREKYEKPDSGIMLHETGAGFSLTTKKKYNTWLSSVLGKTSSLSAAALETLAVIAFKEPVTRSEIEKVRGVSASRVLSSLLEKGLIEERGRLDIPGRPVLYGTTNLFLQRLGISSIQDLKQKWKIPPDEGALF